MGINFCREYFQSKHIGTEYFRTLGFATRMLVHDMSESVGI